jgi:hypothetical protein
MQHVKNDTSTVSSAVEVFLDVQPSLVHDLEKKNYKAIWKLWSEETQEV